MRGLLIVALLLAIPSAVRAQEGQPLRWPTLTYIAAIGSDYTTTAIGLSNGAAEANPLGRWAQDSPPLMLATAIGMDAASIWMWNRFVGRHHPRLAAVGLYVAAGVRVSLAARNVGINQQLDQRRK